MQPTALSSLEEGESGTVSELCLSGTIRDRLRVLGIIEGRRIECLHKSASGSISAYLVCGAVIAIRSRDAQNIIIR